MKHARFDPDLLPVRQGTRNLLSVSVTVNQLVFAQRLESELRASLINHNRRLGLASKCLKSSKSSNENGYK